MEKHNKGKEDVCIYVCVYVLTQLCIAAGYIILIAK